LSLKCVMAEKYGQLEERQEAREHSG
jgi:hypothetical protein